MTKKTKEPVSKSKYFTIYTIESKDLENDHGRHLSGVASKFGLQFTYYQKCIEVTKPGFFTGPGKSIKLCTLYVEGSRVALSKLERFVMQGIGAYEYVLFRNYIVDEGGCLQRCGDLW
jgi:hypothetical protein